jgi:hypothetical protein
MRKAVARVELSLRSGVRYGLLSVSLLLLVSRCGGEPQGPKANERVETTSSALLSSAWTATVSMNVARQNHVAALLLDGSVLVAGGHPGNNTPTSTAEVYSPATGAWTTVGSMGTARRLLGACTLASGKVLVAGGNAGLGDVTSAELFDPSTNTWSATGSLAAAREDFSMTCLSDGRVLVAGGSGPSGLLVSSEVYNPTSGTWSSAGTMPAAVHTQGAVLLNDGRVLIAGGNNASGPVNTAAIWTPSTNAWTATASMATTRAFFALNLLNDGRVLAAGGLVNVLLAATNTAEIYDPSTGSWSAAAHLNTARYSGVSATLAAGPIVVGGVNGGSSLASSESYDLVHNTWTQVATAYGAVNQTATALTPTSVIVAGGNTGPGATTSAQMYGVLNVFALYAQRSVKLGSSDHINGGDVGVAAVAPSGFGPQLVVGSAATVQATHNLVAPSVSLGSQAHVGDVQTNALTNSGATLGTLASYPASMPALPFALPTGSGGSNVTVPAFTIATLNPGNYGALNVTGTVYLNAGSYTFSSVTMANQAHLAGVSGTATVAVTGTFQAGNSVSISSPGFAPAGQLVISVAGYDSGTAPVFSIGTGAAMSAILSAPHGTLSIGSSTIATGAFAGFDVTLGTGVTITYQSGFAAAQRHGQQQLSGYVTPPMAAAPLVGPVPGNALIVLAIGLPEQHAQDLANFIQNASTPGNASFRQYIDAGTFAANYGAPQAVYQQLTSFATANGLTIMNSYPTNLLLQVAGPVSAVEQMLSLNLNYYLRPDGSQFFAPDRNPSINLPPSQVTILRISGLDSVFVNQPGNSTGSSPMSLFTAFDLRNAYLGCAQGALTGAGEAVGVVSYGGYNSPDIQKYDQLNTPPNVTPGNVTTSVTEGQATFLGIPLENGVGVVDTETTADIEAVRAMAPAANIAVYEGPNVSGPGFPPFVNSGAEVEANLWHFIANNHTFGFHQITDSYSMDFSDNVRQALDSLAAQGISVFSYSGDNGGYYPLMPNGPSVPTLAVLSPWTTMVGGTVLSMNDARGQPCSFFKAPCSYASETAWTGSGGGVLGPSIYPTLPPLVGTFFIFGSFFGSTTSVSLPSYQKNINPSNPLVSKTYRNVPDVAAVGAQQFSMIYSNQEQAFGGTSLSSPLWGGFMALVNQRLSGLSGHDASVGPANPSLYASANPAVAGFNDIVNNQGSPSNAPAFNATAGYDLATGLGTPRCALIDQLASHTPGSASPTGLCCSGLTTCQLQAAGPGVCCLHPLVNGQCCAFNQTSTQCCSSSEQINCGNQCCLPGACTNPNIPNGTCCAGGARAVCGSVCCAGTALCQDPTNSVCATPTTPTLVVKDSLGNILAVSPSSTLTLFDTGTYTFVGLDFPAGDVALDLGGTTIAAFTCAGPTAECSTRVMLNSSEDGMSQSLDMFQQITSGGVVVGTGVDASLTVNVETVPLQ